MIEQLLAGPTGLGTSAARLFRQPAPPASADAAPDSAQHEADTAAGSDASSLRIPRFTFPWPGAIHPEANSAELCARAFAERFGLVPDEAYRARLARAQYGRFAARCYPKADRELLQILADYAIWYFPADDLFVDRVQTLSARTLANLTAMTDVLDHHRVGQDPVWGEHAWLDICTRLRSRLTDEHFQRFAHGMRMWASTAGLQILNHLQDDPVDVPQYETIRRHTSGMNPCLDVADAALHRAGHPGRVQPAARAEAPHARQQRRLLEQRRAEREDRDGPARPVLEHGQHLRGEGHNAPAGRGPRGGPGQR